MDADGDAVGAASTVDATWADGAMSWPAPAVVESGSSAGMGDVCGRRRARRRVIGSGRAGGVDAAGSGTSTDAGFGAVVLAVGSSTRTSGAVDASTDAATDVSATDAGAVWTDSSAGASVAAVNTAAAGRDHTVVADSRCAASRRASARVITECAFAAATSTLSFASTSAAWAGADEVRAERRVRAGSAIDASKGKGHALGSGRSEGQRSDVRI